MSPRDRTSLADIPYLECHPERIEVLSQMLPSAILAQTGDPSRFATGRAVVKHAGLAPAGKTCPACSPAGQS